jgi:hypothetical protein
MNPKANSLFHEYWLLTKEFVFASVEHLAPEEAKLTYLKQFKIELTLICTT